MDEPVDNLWTNLLSNLPGGSQQFSKYQRFLSPVQGNLLTC